MIGLKCPRTCGGQQAKPARRSRSLPLVARLGARLGYNARVAVFLRILYHTCGEQNAHAPYGRLARCVIGLRRPRCSLSADIIPHLRWAERAGVVASAQLSAQLSRYARVCGALRILYHTFPALQITKFILTVPSSVTALRPNYPAKNIRTAAADMKYPTKSAVRADGTA